MTNVENYGKITTKRVEANTIEAGIDASLAPTPGDDTHNGDLVLRAHSSAHGISEMQLHSNNPPSLKFNVISQINNVNIIENNNEITDDTNGNTSYTAANLHSGLIIRDPQGSNRDDTVDTATNIIDSITNAQVGDSFEFSITNTPSQNGILQTITLSAPDGSVSMIGDTTIRVYETKRFLVLVKDVLNPTVSIYALGSTKSVRFDWVTVYAPAQIEDDSPTAIDITDEPQDLLGLLAAADTGALHVRHRGGSGGPNVNTDFSTTSTNVLYRGTETIEAEVICRVSLSKGTSGGMAVAIVGFLNGAAFTTASSRAATSIRSSSYGININISYIMELNLNDTVSIGIEHLETPGTTEEVDIYQALLQIRRVS